MDVEQLAQVGTAHPAVKRALGLVRTADPDGVRVLVEGIWAHEALLATDTPIESAWLCPEAMWSDRARDLAAAVADHAADSARISTRTLGRLVERDRPDGLVSVALPRRWGPQDLQFGDQALVLVADGLETPGNLGTLIRTLDACAADALVVTDRRTPVLHPKVFRASHGASLTVPYVVFDDTDAAAGWLHEHEFSVLLADAVEDAVGYRDADWTGRVALVLGNERYGVSPTWRARGSRSVAVPMLGRGDSLNAAVAASVLLFEARARQGAPRTPSC
jgi:tRNA G18 (ribose-2'-O)-methylase SpoU